MPADMIVRERAQREGTRSRYATHDRKRRRTEASAKQPGRVMRWMSMAALITSLLWLFRGTLLDWFAFLRSNEDYSGGLLVPFVAAYVLWSRRREWREVPRSVCWWGLAGLVGAVCLRFYAVYYYYGSLERYAFLLAVISLTLLLLGWSLTWRLRWILLFLFLMAPLPIRIHNAVAMPLQAFATSSGVFVLEMLGFWAESEGNLVTLNDSTRVGVAEACSGLRMLTAFVLVTATLALLVRRPGWQKAVLVLSSIPIAIVANTLRVVITAMVIHASDTVSIEMLVHDAAGVAMMPLALGIALLELRLLDRARDPRPLPATAVAGGTTR